MARVEVLKNVSINTGVKLYREDTIQPTTKCLLDFRSNWSGAAKNLPVLSVIKNLAYYDNDAQVTSGHAIDVVPYLNKGLRFNQTNARCRITLHEDQAPKFTDQNWLAQFYLSPEIYSQAGSSETVGSGNNQLFHIGQNLGQGPADCILTINPIVGSDKKTLTGLNIFGRGIAIQITRSSSATGIAILDALSATTIKKTHIAVSVKVGAAQTALTLIVNNTLKLTNSANNVVTTIQNTKRNLNSDSGFPAVTEGTYYRYRFDDMTNSVLSVDELVALDYQACLTAFS